jgi:DNA polymerase III alpha subunit
VTLETGQWDKTKQVLSVERLDCTIFSELYASSRELLTGSQLVVAALKVQDDPAQKRLRCHAEQLWSVNEACVALIKKIRIVWDKKEHSMLQIDALKKLLGKEGVPVEIDYRIGEYAQKVTLGEAFCLSVSLSLLQRLEELFGQDALIYEV